MRNKIGVAAAIMVAYHVAAVIKDGEQCMLNWNQLQANPTPENLVRFLVADGVLTKDLVTL